jgi:hypothetical protein
MSHHSSGRPRARGRHSGQFFTSVVAAGLLVAAPSGDARTEEKPSPPAFERFAIRVARPAPFERGEIGAGDPSAQARGAVDAALGTGWSVGATSPDASEFDVLPPRTEAGSGLTTGQAWDKAYTLRKDRRVEHAEPLFTTPADPREEFGPQDCVAARIESSGGKDLPEAADVEWSLGAAGANVVGAWKLFEQRGRKPGEGITVGHPDTGYRKHPELWSADPAATRVLTDAGWDFVDGDGDPFDDLAEGFMRNPGHGTRTASVIVSPPKSQRPDFPRGISGVAPEARLVPMRVARSVVQLSQSRLTQAIRDAAGEDRTRVKRKADVISISLGGVPSRRLRDALTFAERQNVIVLAAAGNHVGTVVWPARYEHIVAVAASNARSGTWGGSSHGSAVDITAPGESVWVASTRREAADAPIMDCLQPGSGTSYAVATTAGAAALWLSYHAGTPEMRALRDRSAVAWAFRSLVSQAFRNVDGWRSGFGPGILDAAKLLSLPLPAPPERAVTEAEVSPCEADLETLLSIFEGASDPRRRAARLLRRRAADLCDVSEVGDEIAFHYALDDRVRRALDALAGPSEPPASAYGRARRALQTRDLSRRLRRLL